MAEWYVSHGGKTYGPYSPAQLKQLATSAKINTDTQVRLGADGKWTRAKNVKELFEESVVTKPVAPAEPASMAQSVATAVAARLPPTATMPCPFCGQTIETTVEICPHCHEFPDDYQPPSLLQKYVVPMLTTLGVIIALCFLAVNLLGGLVSGIWLAVKGEWGFIIGGILAGVVMPWGFSIAALPAIGLGLLLLLTGDPPPRLAMATIGFLCALWNAILVQAWTLWVFIAFMRHAEPGLTIPLLLWSYVTIMSPLVYMAKFDRNSEGTGIMLTFAVFSFAVLTVLFLSGALQTTMFVAVGVLAVITALICTVAGVAMIPPKHPQPA